MLLTQHIDIGRTWAVSGTSALGLGDQRTVFPLSTQLRTYWQLNSTASLRAPTLYIQRLDEKFRTSRSDRAEKFMFRDGIIEGFEPKFKSIAKDCDRYFDALFELSEKGLIETVLSV